jgi:proteasome accessory factor B
VMMRYADPDGLARWLVGYGADVVVLAPDEVRKATLARLRDLVDALDARSAAHDPAGAERPAAADVPEAVRP